MTRLDIFADPVCPWCLIAQTELDRALDSRPGHPFVITWHPFRLNPDIPPQGRDRVAHLHAKLGDKAHDAARVMAARALDLGLVLNPSGREPDTTDAHRLMHWAGLQGAQHGVMSGLLQAHWLRAQDISDPVILTAVAQQAGMDPALTARLLASDADHTEVANRESHARARGITVVPTFIVADSHAVTGAQPAALWQQVIDEIMAASHQG